MLGGRGWIDIQNFRAFRKEHVFLQPDHIRVAFDDAGQCGRF